MKKDITGIFKKSLKSKIVIYQIKDPNDIM